MQPAFIRDVTSLSSCSSYRGHGVSLSGAFVAHPFALAVHKSVSPRIGRAGVPRTRFIDGYALTQAYVSAVSRLDTCLCLFSAGNYRDRLRRRSIFVRLVPSLFAGRGWTLSVQEEGSKRSLGVRDEDGAEEAGRSFRWTIIDLPLARGAWTFRRMTLFNSRPC